MPFPTLQFFPTFDDDDNEIPSDFFKVDELHDYSGTPFKADGNREYMRNFLVLMSDIRWGILEVALAPGLPEPWSPYVNVYTGFSDRNALLIDVSIKRIKEKTGAWIVTCKYSTQVPKSGPADSGIPVTPYGDEDDGAENDLDLEPPEFEFEYEEVNVPARSDLDDKAFVNSAWQPFTPTPNSSAPKNDSGYQTKRIVL